MNSRERVFWSIPADMLLSRLQSRPEGLCTEEEDRIILALKRSGNVVGYIGDGINGASALHSPDVGISVGRAVDVAKDAADIVLGENIWPCWCKEFVKPAFTLQTRFDLKQVP